MKALNSKLRLGLHDESFANADSREILTINCPSAHDKVKIPNPQRTPFPYPDDQFKAVKVWGKASPVDGTESDGGVSACLYLMIGGSFCFFLRRD